MRNPNLSGKQQTLKPLKHKNINAKYLEYIIALHNQVEKAGLG